VPVLSRPEGKVNLVSKLLLAAFTGEEGRETRSGFLVAARLPPFRGMDTVSSRALEVIVATYLLWLRLAGIVLSYRPIL